MQAAAAHARAAEVGGAAVFIVPRPRGQWTPRLLSMLRVGRENLTMSSPHFRNGLRALVASTAATVFYTALAG